ncbi:MAG: hypothetical protein PW792_12660 [Acidobacteriaceae bacterium]|nr:hypothetical protein [Acidobacteriaceae bacterium]
MATADSKQIAQRIPGEKSSLPTLALLAGWIVPGAGHLVVGKPIRAALLFVSILGMFLTGLALAGKIYSPGTGDILDMLCFAGQLGMGLLYALAKGLGWGATSAINTMADYGSKFLVCAGLLNLIAAVDAYSLANGRKAS